ncbi:hypothetical protein [Streptomyces javensis]|uniref:Uncharacterized protein n=1 Tax=Streptomyces javensis TaxID=114698 RepID=A0ABN1WWH2_9ACTN
MAFSDYDLRLKATKRAGSRAYDVRIEVRGRQGTPYLDGRKWGSFTDDKAAEPFRQVVTRDKATDRSGHRLRRGKLNQSLDLRVAHGVA